MTAATAVTVAAIQEHCRALRLPLVAAQCERLAQDALRHQHSPLEYLASLLGAEVDDRERRAIARRLQEARLPRLKTLEDFDFSPTSPIRRKNERNLLICCIPAAKGRHYRAVDEPAGRRALWVILGGGCAGNDSPS